MSVLPASLYDIPIHRITGEDASLGDYRGEVLLLVNVASQCGLTGQYAALESLYTRFKDSGFAVLGFPANDFGAQEPGTNAEIAEFCTKEYNVDFPMFEKIVVTGPETHPLYRALIAAQPTATGPKREGFRNKLKSFLDSVHPGKVTNPEPGILWNFEKFLIGRDGVVVARFSPEIVPDDPIIISTVESALAK
jgi:glutathione peroxidase